jgi:hypothetical protein
MPRTFHRTENKVQEKYEPIEKVYRPLHTMVRDNFIGGMVWALGATVGIALIAALLGLLVNVLGGVPFVGERLADLVSATNQALKGK